MNVGARQKTTQINKRVNRRSAQRKAFVAYITHVKGAEETWTGWRKDLLLKKLSEASEQKGAADLKTYSVHVK